MLARVRIGVPDRPGVLGQVASAVGRAGADITMVDVLENQAGRALDDLFVDVRDQDQIDALSAQLMGVTGVSLEGVQAPATPSGGHHDLELLGQVLDRPDRGLRTLVDGAPRALGADWGALVEFGPNGEPGGVIAMSPQAPGEDHVKLTAPLRLSTPSITPPGAGEPYVGVALVPVEGLPVGLVLVREQGPAYHRSELWRLEKMMAIVGHALS